LSRGNRSRPSGERSAEERERAREERERRRAARSGGGAGNGLLEDSPDLGGRSPAPPAGEQHDAIPPPARDPDGAADHSPAAGPVVPSEPLAADASFEQRPATPLPGDAPADGYGEAAIADEADAQAPASHLEEAPGGWDRAAAGPEIPPEAAMPADSALPPAEAGVGPEAAVHPGSETQPESPAPLPPAPRVRAPRRESLEGHPPSLRSHAPRSALSRIIAVAALAAAIAAVFLLVRSLTGSGHSKTNVAAPAAERVLIPEGKTGAQIAEIAASAGLKGSYRSAAKRSALLNPAHYGAPRGTAGLEGFLFPATYELTPSAPVGRLVDEQLAAFKENFGSQEIRRARALHITPYELLTVASMIEREAEVPGDRAKIAAVIYNRLHRGMPLGIDATIYYAVEQRTGIATYTRELSEAQLHIDSPYNTRNRPGLPPTPISNPGVASIQAAAHPAHASYLYYVAAADGCGEHVFSTSLAAFEKNAAAYQAALRANGGRLPACKKK
jgi:UPF0755 protein